MPGMGNCAGAALIVEFRRAGQIGNDFLMRVREAACLKSLAWAALRIVEAVALRLIS